QGKYRLWAKSANFESKLPGDVKKRKAAMEVVVRTLDQDLKEKKAKECAITYSDSLFRQAAIEWLIATDQPINVFEHPKFKFMIEVSSQATRGICVKIPSGKTTQAEIKRMFGKTMTDLKQRLSVSPL
ncbi:hypothetical protein M378DRAFT_90015, partial [Amanita muscaria Koide BX008]